MHILWGDIYQASTNVKEFLYVTECTKLGFFGAKLLEFLITLLGWEKMWNASRICVSSLRRGHANLLCIVPILVYVLPKQVQLLVRNDVIISLTYPLLPGSSVKQLEVKHFINIP